MLILLYQLTYDRFVLVGITPNGLENDLGYTSCEMNRRSNIKAVSNGLHCLVCNAPVDLFLTPNQTFRTVSEFGRILGDMYLKFYFRHPYTPQRLLGPWPAPLLVHPWRIGYWCCPHCPCLPSCNPGNQIPGSHTENKIII
jgi:hypothetical protein